MFRLPTTSLRHNLFLAIQCVILLFVLAIGFGVEGSQQFSELALAFLHGHVYFLHAIGGEGQDPVLYHGHVYWSEGPFPSILLMPFVAVFSLFHHLFYQGYLKWSLLLGVLYFVFKLAQKFRYTRGDSLTLALGFTLGSAFIGVASVSSSWLFAQVVTTFLLFWSLYEYYGKRRWWLIGVLCGLVFLTRATAAPIFIFFGLELWQHTDHSQRFKKLAVLCTPLLGAVVLQAVYNFLRFHNPLNGGYEYQLLGPGPAASRALGVFSLQHIPSNLYALLFAAPVTVLRNPLSWTLSFPYIQSNPDGLSIIFTSPYLLYLFTKKWSSFDKTVRNILLAAGISCLGVLCFYGLGRDQLGDRYSLDFLPELFLVFMIMYRQGHGHISRGMQYLLFVSVLLDFYLLLSFIAW
jgi:hypothetical protein